MLSTIVRTNFLAVVLFGFWPERYLFPVNGLLCIGVCCFVLMVFSLGCS